MKDKKSMNAIQWQKVLVLAFLGIVILLAILRCGRNITENHTKVIMDTLKNESREESSQVTTTIEEHLKMLDGISSEISVYLENGKAVEDILSIIEPVRKLYSLERIGFLDLKGQSVTTDGFYTDLSFRDFYQKGIQGKKIVTEVLTDQLASAADSSPVIYINVFSTPVYSSKGDILGGVFATYRTEKVYKELGFDYQGQYGELFLLDRNGVLLMGPCEEKETYNCMMADGKLLNVARNQKENEVLVLPYRCNKHNFSGYVSLNRIPVCEEEEYDWFIIDVVSSEKVNQILEYDIRDIRRMLAVVTIVIVISFVYFGWATHLEYRRKKEELEIASYHDFLTDGDNYQGFCQKLSESKMSRYVVSVDINQFNVINTVCGSTRGDEVLAILHDSLRKILGDSELVGHLSGDAFVFTLTEVDEESIGIRLKEIQNTILQLSEKESVPDMVPCFGISYYQNGDEPKNVINQANIAKQKNKGKDSQLVCFYSEEDDLQQVKEKNLMDSFEDALGDDHFVVWFQPQFSSREGDIYGAEALVRMVNKRGGFIPPSEFIPVFEKYGRIGELDRFVFETVCKRLNMLKREGKKLLPISVNLSRASLYRENLISDYLYLLDKYGLSPSMIPLEITESAVADEKHIRTLTEELKKNGFTLYMDDFGSGYSSLVDLGMMQFDVIKLDRKLIGQIGSPNGERILRHTIQMAREMNIHLVAEGVETKEQQEFLTEYGVDKIQGFYYSKPLPEEAFGVLCDKYLIHQNVENHDRLQFLDNSVLHKLFMGGQMEYTLAEKIMGAFGIYSRVNDKIILHSVNDEFLKLFRTTFGKVDLMQRDDMAQYVIESYRETYENMFEIAEKNPEHHDQKQICFETLDGNRFWCQVDLVWMEHLSTSDQNLFLACFTDYTDFVQMKEILTSLPGGLVAYRADGNEEILFVNQELVRMFGCENEAEFRELTGNSFKGMLHPDDLEWVEDSIHRQICSGTENLDSVTYRIIRKDGSVVRINDYGRLATTELFGSIFYVFMSDAVLDHGTGSMDQEEIMSTINQLKYDSTHDKLTGFLNQTFAEDEVNRLIQSKPNADFAMAVYDLDDFKLLNDTYGHEFGNRVLQESAAFFHNSFPEALLHSRVGGDEFMMLFELKEKLTKEALLNKLRQKTHWRIDEKLINASMGVVFSNDTERSRRAMFLAADEAMYRIKKNGKNGLWVYKNDGPDDIYKGIIKAEAQEDEKVIEQYCRFIDSVQDLSSEYMYILDFENDFYYISPKAEKRFLMKSHHFNGVAEGHREFVFEYDYPHITKELKNLVEEKREKHDMVYRWRLKDGKPVWIHCHGAVHMKNGRPWFMLGFISEMNQ